MGVGIKEYVGYAGMEKTKVSSHQLSTELVNLFRAVWCGWHIENTNLTVCYVNVVCVCDCQVCTHLVLVHCHIIQKRGPALARILTIRVPNLKPIFEI